MPAGYSAGLALLIAGPLLGSGYLLLRDAVSTPRSYLTGSALGLGDAAPRAVPQDALLAVLSPVIDGGVLVKAILLIALWAAGYGAAVLARELLRVGLGPQLVASTVALWNPYIAERLLQGHWSLLAGYAALPWTVLAAYRLRIAASEHLHRTPPAPDAGHPPGAKGERSRWRTKGTGSSWPANGARSDRHTEETSGTKGVWLRWRATGSVGAWGALTACFAAAGLTPTGGLLAGATALVVLGRRQIPGALLLLALASAPWLAATVLSGAGAEPSDPAGIAAFAARAEPGLATLGSLAGLGGIWNADAVPNSRTTLLALFGTLILLAIVATGIRAVASPISTRAGNAGTPRAELGSASTAITDVDDQDRAEGPATAGGEHPRTDPNTSDEAIGNAYGAKDKGGQSSADRLGNEEDSSRVRVSRALLLLAGVAVVLPALAATGWGREVMEWLVVQVPGAGLLRDTQKYVALAVPAYSLCAAAGCRAFAVRFAGSKSHLGELSTGIPKASGMAGGTGRAQASPAGTGLIATVFIALLILPLIDLAWGVGGALRPVHYPAGWQQVAEKIDGRGDVAVLPGGMFRKFSYSGKAPVLDPAPRMLPNDVLQTGELPVRGAVVSGEGMRAHQVESLLLQGGSAQRLGDLGVGWVLVERATPGSLGESKNTLAELEPVYSDSQLALYRVAGVQVTESQAAHRFIAGAAHILWAALLLGGLLVAGLWRRD
ncbi:hypothetical protein [Nocardia sp. XZ_19_385]|uniref:hypothetical protein n=1 Tax=Nocardia sp. XZ_19_385 TaxID=2769488 RepID=UPI0035CD09AF